MAPQPGNDLLEPRIKRLVDKIVQIAGITRCKCFELIAQLTAKADVETRGRKRRAEPAALRRRKRIPEADRQLATVHQVIGHRQFVVPSSVQRRKREYAGTNVRAITGVRR